MEKISRKSEIKLFETVYDVLNSSDGSYDHQEYRYTIEVDEQVIAEENTLSELFKRIAEGWY